MGSIQQEIRNFHEHLKPTLQKVLTQYGEKNPPNVYHTIVVPCKRLIQKCSCKSLFDVSTLCSFTYWLYIDGQGELALEVCERTHHVNFVCESSWICGYPALCGLEIRIARELLHENRRDRIPSDLLEYYFSKRVQKGLRYPQILREEKIKTCSDRLLTLELLEALYQMIGKGETGLYSQLNENWMEIEETIRLYLDCLNLDLKDSCNCH